MQSVDKLLYNTTNRLALSPSQSTSEVQTSSSNFSKQILLPIVSRPPRELLGLNRLSKLLEEEILEAKEQQVMMMELFEKIGRLERGEEKNSRKMQRRSKEQLDNKFQCHHEGCKRFYSTEATLQRHIRLKHHIVKNEPPQPFVDLPPWPNLTQPQEPSYHHQQTLSLQLNSSTLTTKP